MSTEEERMLCPSKIAIGDLRASFYLGSLTEKERKYAIYLMLAAWSGFPNLVRQSSMESPKIYDFIDSFLTVYPKESLKNPEGPLLHAMEYFAWFLNNGGNYKGSGDTKYIPRLSKEEFKAIVKDYPETAAKLEACIEDMYDTHYKRLGFHPDYTAYYQPNDFTEDEQKGVDAVLREAHVRIENTMIAREDGKYKVLIPSVEKSEKEVGEFNGMKVVLTYGFHSDELAKAVEYLEKAKEFAANDTQVSFLNHLISSYKTGSIEDHVKYSIDWVKDVDPAVESYQGYIETYRDPAGLRAEYEGFVACVDPEESKILHQYVESSKTVLPLLPYPKEYERSNFLPPSYNSLNILSFVTSMQPIGINIPNYDEVRLNTGFKNVTLTNVMAAIDASEHDEKFLDPSFVETYFKHVDKSTPAHVASHELYGHGSGRLLLEKDLGVVSDILFPDKKVTTSYKEGEGFEKYCGGFAASFEECRAETTATYLLMHDEVLKIFGVKPEDYEDFKRTEITYMIRRALYGLVNFDPATMKWGQAHARARLCLLNGLLIWGEESVSIQKTADGSFHVKVGSIEKCTQALRTLLLHLTAYKATNQPTAANTFYTQMTLLPPQLLEIREYVLREPPAFKMFVGALLEKDGDGFKAVEIHEGPKTLYDVVYTPYHNARIALGKE